MSYFPFNKDNAGNVLVSTEGAKITYRSALNTSMPASGTIGISSQMFGSATKLVKVTRVYMSFVFTTAQIVNPFVIRYSSLPTGGTSAAWSPAAMDANDSAPTATNLLNYSVAPTEGVRNGLLMSAYGIAGSATVQPTIFDWAFGDLGTKPIYLRGTSDGIGIFINSVGAAGATKGGFIEWTEE